MTAPDRGMTMAEAQGACDFLAAIETLLRDKVVGASIGEARFAALMAASAIGMARRETSLSERLAAARHSVAALAPLPMPFTDPLQALIMLIREGFMDGQDELFQRLMVDAVVRTAVTRPQILSQKEKSLAGLEGD